MYIYIKLFWVQLVVHLIKFNSSKLSECSVTSDAAGPFKRWKSCVNKLTTSRNPVYKYMCIQLAHRFQKSLFQLP